MTDEVTTLKEALFSFDGRLRRRDWWLLSIGTNLCNGALGLLVSLLFRGLDGYAASMRPEAVRTAPTAELVADALLNVLFLWPWLALTVKRRHDRGRKGWVEGGLLIVFVLLGLVPSADLMAPTAHSAGGAPILLSDPSMALVWLATAASGLSLAAAGWMLVVLGFLPGDPGPNAYGPSPKGEGDPAEEFS